MKNITLSVVVPVYNEEAVINETYARLKKVLDDCNTTYEVIFVDDGSRDATFAMASKICSEDKNFKLISFSRNFGHQPAITAGMMYSKGDAVVVIDADLQDPPEVIPEMLAKWREGWQVVYGQRKQRKGETAFKRFTASAFYRILNCMTDVKIPVDTGDFRLIDRKVCDVLNSLPEHNRYVRGMVSWAGFRQTAVEFVREKRFAGETKYPLKKMLKFACDGIVSFSNKPLGLSACAGVIFVLLSILCFIFAITGFRGGVFPMTSLLLLVEGIILIALGILGSYVGRIYAQVKGRPLFIVNESIGFDKDE